MFYPNTVGILETRSKYISFPHTSAIAGVKSVLSARQSVSLTHRTMFNPLNCNKGVLAKFRESTKWTFAL